MLRNKVEVGRQAQAYSRGSEGARWVQEEERPKHPKKKDKLDRYNKTKGRPTPNVSLAESDEDEVKQPRLWSRIYQ